MLAEKSKFSSLCFPETAGAATASAATSAVADVASAAAANATRQGATVTGRAAAAAAASASLAADASLSGAVDFLKLDFITSCKDRDRVYFSNCRLNGVSVPAQIDGSTT